VTIGLGCMRLSTDAARDPERGCAVIAAAVDAGIALLDTADAYALDDADAGHNERLIARALARRAGPSAGPRVEIATKGGLVRPGGAWQACGHPPGPPVCWCRKPLPGLALAHAHGHGLARSLHLGKGPADRGFATRAGMRYADIADGWPAPDASA